MLQKSDIYITDHEFMLHFIKNKGQYLSGSGTGFIKSVYTKVDYYRET